MLLQYLHIEQTLNSLRDVDPRNAAEYAYVLAQLYKQAGNNEQAIRFGRESIALLNRCKLDTTIECSTQNVVIEGIALPEFIHQDVVRDRLKPLVL